MKKLLGISLAWLLLAGSLAVPIGVYSAFATGGQIANPVSTSTVLSSNAVSTMFGHSITFTATVSPSTATGTVQFNDSSTILGTGTISGGQATFTTSSLSVGSHNIIAKYLGDTNDAASTSAPLTQVVNQIIITTTTLASSQNPSIISHSVTFTATVSPNTATGIVQFNDSSTILGTGAISSGQATFTTQSLSLGSHNIIAKYLGDTNDAPSTSTLTQTVNQISLATTTTTLASSQNPSIISHSITFTATVSPNTATGIVEFDDSGANTILGTSTISSGQATFTIQSLSIGSHNIVAKYLGDTNDASSTSTFTQTVNQINTSTTTTILTSSQNPSIISHSVTFTATVSPSTATGTVQFNDSSTILGTGTISGGQATFTTSSLSIGSHNIIAKYLGDTNDAPSMSTLTQVVNQISLATTTTTVLSSANPSTFGQSVSFTATITPNTATGTVQFAIDGVNTGSPVTLSGGTASISSSSLSIGSHTITAAYLGDTNDAASTSSVLVQTVNQISLATTTTTLVSSKNPSTTGNSVTFTATVSPSTATGTVQFNDSSTNPSTILGTSTISSGQATFATSLSIGSHNIVARYLGNTNDAPSTSTLTQTVNQVTITSSTISLSSNTTSTIFGHSVTFTATVSPSTATGTVQLLLSGTNFGSPVALSGGQAIFTTSSIPVGTYSLTASYSGDINFNPSTSNSVPISTIITIGGSGSAPGSVGGNNDDNHDEKNADDNNNGNHNGEKNSDNDNNNGNHNGEKNSDNGNGNQGKNDNSKQKQDHSNDKHGDD